MPDKLKHPVLINQIVSKRSGEVVTAQEFNEYLNLLIKQGDASEEELTVHHAAIEKAFGDIADNAQAIQNNADNIATNATNISTNTENIATLAGLVGENIDNIKENAAATRKNASDISTIKSTQQTDREQIDRNTISIGINRNNIRKKIDESERGVANGVATLNEDGKVPAEQLPPPPVIPQEVFTAVITDEVGRLVCDMTASEIINASRSGIVKATYTDDATGETRTYQYAKQTDDSRAVFEKPGYIEDGVTHQSLIYVDYAGNVTVETREPTAVTCYATCNAEAAPSTSTPVTWYVPKTMPRPSGNVGMMIDVFWANGRSDGLGYDISLVWGSEGGADNETIVPTASVSDDLTGEYSIPAEGTVRYQLVEQSGRKRWKYVSGDVISKQFSTATAAATAEKAVPGMALTYLPGMEIYVQLDNGNTAETMRLVPDEGATLPVYGNGTGAKTGDIPAGAILHLKNAGDHWQIVNGGSGGNQIDDTVISPDTAWSSAKIAQTVAPALTNTVSDSVIAVDDVSPLEHQVGCRVESKNILPFPYFDGGAGESFTDQGITFSVLDDGKIYVSGKNTSDRVINFAMTDSGSAFDFKTKTLGVSFKVTGNKQNVNYIFGLGDFEFVTITANKTYNGMSTSGTKVVYNIIQVSPAAEVDCICEPMVCVGSLTELQPYTPYIPDLSAVTVSRYGKNLAGRYSAGYPGGDGKYHLDNDSFSFIIPVNAGIKIHYHALEALPQNRCAAAYSKEFPYDGCDLSSISAFGNEITDQTITVPNEQTYRYMILLVNAQAIDPSIPLSRCQAEIGESFTGFEKSNVQTLTPSPDGTVTGMTSLSPDMTILTDNPGAIVTAEYNQNPITVIQKLTDRIAALENTAEPLPSPTMEV